VPVPGAGRLFYDEEEEEEEEEEGEEEEGPRAMTSASRSCTHQHAPARTHRGISTSSTSPTRSWPFIYEFCPNSKQMSRRLPNPTLSYNPDTLRGHDVTIDPQALWAFSEWHTRCDTPRTTGQSSCSCRAWEKQTRRSHERLQVQAQAQS